jgi:hypothetical protein
MRPSCDPHATFMRLARISPPLAAKRVACMTAFRMVRGSAVHYLDTALEPQLYRLDRLWEPGSHGRLTGHSPDTRRTLPVDNFQTPGSASSLRRISQYKPSFRLSGGRPLPRVWATLESGYATVGTQRPCHPSRRSAVDNNQICLSI